MIWRAMQLVAAAAVIISLSRAGEAAAISAKKIGNTNVIAIIGKIEIADVATFEAVSSSSEEFSTGQTIVLLNSDGGNLLAGLSIGQNIRSHQLSTAVLSGSECASVCSLMWLAGTNRYLGASARVGFHAAYVGSGDDAKEFGQANALVGAYLAKLGLSYEAVAFATAAGPTQMNWLHPSDAAQTGIRFSLIPDETRSRPPEHTATAYPNGTATEQQAAKLILSYYADWSRPGTDVESLAQYYGDAALYYGRRHSRDRIMDEKRKFSIRWPIRRYAIKPRTFFVQCSADTCSVIGVVEWDVASIERNARSLGTANFVLKVRLSSSGVGGIILSESGSVLSAHNDTLRSSQATPATDSVASAAASPAYAEGRQARLDYEAWFKSLAPGEFRDGAEFWAGNRSLKSPPSCIQAGKSSDWQAGCAAARIRLATVDARRHTEKDYRLGWNSL